jgi:hypothetical protein
MSAAPERINNTSEKRRGGAWTEAISAAPERIENS